MYHELGAFPILKIYRSHKVVGNFYFCSDTIPNRQPSTVCKRVFTRGFKNTSIYEYWESEWFVRTRPWLHVKWRGVMWHGVVWCTGSLASCDCDAAWCSVMWCGVLPCGMVWCSLTWCDCDAAWCAWVFCTSVQFCTASTRGFKKTLPVLYHCTVHTVQPVQVLGACACMHVCICVKNLYLVHACVCMCIAWFRLAGLNFLLKIVWLVGSLAWFKRRGVSIFPPQKNFPIVNNFK